jgi:hypothetical protein
MREDTKRLEETTSVFYGYEKEFRVRRFDAHGPDRKSANRTWLSVLCPDKTLACSQSHKRLALRIVSEGRDCLVLEDDTFPAMHISGLQKRIADCIQAAGPLWDMILLNTMGPGCMVPPGDRPGRFCGSSAAYMISVEGAVKLSQAKVSWHFDLLRNSDIFNVRQGTPIFLTRDKEPSGIVLGGRDVVWFLNQPFLRWVNGGSLKLWAIILCVILSIFGIGLASILSACGFSTSSVTLSLISSIILAFITSLVWHTSRDTNFARCSWESRCLLAGTAVSSVLFSLISLKKGEYTVLASLTLYISLTCLGLIACWTDESYVEKRRV